MLPIPLAKANVEKTTGGKRGSSLEIMVMSLFQTAVNLCAKKSSVSRRKTHTYGQRERVAYPSAKKPNSSEKITRTLRFVENPQRRKQLSDAPMQEMVTTVRVGQRSLR